MWYSNFIRPLLFRLDSEFAHDTLIKVGRLCQQLRLGCLNRALWGYKAKGDLSQRIAGIDFAGPIGLAAGFDKQAQLPEFFASLGFTHLELGTVTKLAQPGNPKPRIFRFPKDQALVNSMGFPSVGSEQFLENLLRSREFLKSDTALGVNIGKNKATALDSAIDDYTYLIKLFRKKADYFTINISSPNTPNLRELFQPEKLEPLLLGCKQESQDIPLFLKLPPDLSEAEIKVLCDIALESKIDALIATNTSIDRSGLIKGCDLNQGGVSGAPLKSSSIRVVKTIYDHLGKEIPIIGVGAIMTPKDAIEMIEAGASLLQIYTGLIYYGPALVRDCIKQIDQTLQDRGLQSVSDLVGNPIVKS